MLGGCIRLHFNCDSKVPAEGTGYTSIYYITYNNMYVKAESSRNFESCKNPALEAFITFLLLGEEGIQQISVCILMIDQYILYILYSTSRNPSNPKVVSRLKRLE